MYTALNLYAVVGVCSRVGGKENFFHCLKCDLCLSVAVKDSHKVNVRFSLHTRGLC